MASVEQELLQRATQVVELARTDGAAGARVRAYRSRQSTTEWRNGQLDRVGESTRQGLEVTLYVDGRYAFNVTSDLRPAALAAFVADAVAMTRRLSPDPDRVLPDAALYADRSTADLASLDPNPEALPAAEARALAAAVEAGARDAASARRIVSVTTSATRRYDQEALVASNGLAVTRAATAYAANASVSVESDDARKPSAWWVAETRRLADLPHPADIGREATRRATQLVGAAPLPSGRYPCVIENVAAGRLLLAMLPAFQGRSLQQRSSFLAERMGQAVGSRAFQLVDDPLRSGGLGSRAYDEEGLTTRYRVLADHGTLAGYLLDTYYARKLGLAANGGTPSNLIVAPGSRDRAALVAGLQDGILVTGFIGGNANPATGAFSLGIRGARIRAGQPPEPVAEMNLSGNFLDLWNALEEAGSDLYPYASVAAPSLLFAPLGFSGT